MKLKRFGKISCLEPAWAGPSRVVAGFSTRNGGVSRPPYNSLNLAFHADDLAAHVEGNRATLTRSLGYAPGRLLTVNQVHGTDLLVIDEPNPDLSHFQRVACDAVATDQPGLLLGILTADCFPVLLCDPKRRVVAAVHVGWRGAAAGILARTIAGLADCFGCRPGELRAAVGPGIGAHRYEVDRPVRDAFRAGAGGWEEIAVETSLGKWQLDLRRSCLLQLAQAGLAPGHCAAAEECTCCHREMFFSYRRDAGRTGRQVGFIGLPAEA